MIFVLSLVLKTLLKKEQQGFICLAENECVRVKNQENAGLGLASSPNLLFLTTRVKLAGELHLKPVFSVQKM